MIRVFNIPALKEAIYFEAVERGLGLLHDAVEASFDDEVLADLARFYIEARNRWEPSREWRAAVQVVRD